MRTLVIASMILITASCTKFGKNVTLKGRVVNPVTGEGIAGAEVNLYRIAGAYDSKYKTIKSATTDASGHFELDKYTWAKPVARCETVDLYQLGWTKDGGQTFIDNFELEVKKGKVTNADFYAVPYGNYKIIVNNINCQGANDTIIIKRTNQVGSFLAVDWILTGCSGYNSSFSKAPMGTVYTHYTVIRNGISNEFDVNFEILPNQDNIQTINF